MCSGIDEVIQRKDFGVVTREFFMQKIDNTIRHIWLNEIKYDYDNGYLLREDSLKNSLYFHMRTKLGDVLSNNNLRIYPEFYFQGLKYRADLAIVQIDAETGSDYLKDNVRDVAAIFELKYVNPKADERAYRQWILDDVKKIKHYIQDGKLNAQFYFAVIYESEKKRMNWIDKRSSNHWAKSRVTELDAAIVGNEMCFEIHRL